MGVDGFHKYLTDTGLKKEVKPGMKVGVIAVDLADILHVAARRANCFYQVLRQTISALKLKLKQFRLQGPKMLCIFMDGPAPLAKLSTQIKRRRTQQARGSRKRAEDRAKSDKKGYTRVDGLWLSPGTRLTDMLEAGIRKAFPNAYVSGCRQPGEGEIKAVEYLSKRASQLKGQTIIFLGGDADLVLIASAAKSLQNVHVVHSKQGGKRGALVSVDVSNFWKHCAKHSADQISREDISVLAMMTGNDYLPKLSGAAVGKLLSCYKKQMNFKGGGSHIVDSNAGNLRASALLALFNGLRDSVSRPLQGRKVGKKGGAQPPPWERFGSLSDAAAKTGLHSDSIAKIANGQTKPGRERGWVYEWVEPTKAERNKCVCQGGPCNPPLYFSGLAWCFNMYSTGKCSNVDYVYSYPRGSPCIANSRAYLEHLIDKNPDARVQPPFNTNAPPLMCDEALLLLIPSWGKDVLPDHLRKFMQHPELKHYFPPACDTCDRFSVERQSLQREMDGLFERMKQLKDAGVDDETLAVESKTIVAAKKNRLKFDETYAAHCRQAHPYVEPPINTVRRLVGDAKRAKTKAKAEAHKPGVVFQKFEDLMVTTPKPARENKPAQASEDPIDLSEEQMKLVQPRLERMMIRMLQQEKFVHLMHTQFIEEMKKNPNMMN
jgi:hypothetical protein